MAELAEVRATLETLVAEAGSGAVGPTVDANLEQVRTTMETPPAIQTLCSAFGLSSFERKLLLMCAGVELDSRFAALLAAVNKDPHQPLPTFSLALANLGDAHWSALLPTRPLRFWRLIEVMAGDTLTTSPLRIDEGILHYLTGMSALDERLRDPTQPVTEGEALPASHRAMSELIAASWSRATGQSLWPVVQLCGTDLTSRRCVATAACALLGLRLRLMPAAATPRGMAEIDLFIRLWEREAALNPTALLLEFDENENADPPGEVFLKRLVETLRSPLLISTRERQKSLERRVHSYEVPRASPGEQLQAWKEALGDAAAALDGRVESLVSQFSLSPGDISAVVAQALPVDESTEAMTPCSGDDDSPAPPSEDRLAGALWGACRLLVRPRLDGLAQRLEPSATWADLVLPEMQKQILSQIAVHVRQRSKVYDTWGFATKGKRGLGISALFAGPSGTGKTMAGEVLAHELRLDLYRIDLSQVVSKYIGETEKNLRRVFDAAEGGAAILLFDEADALFGKRSEVKDSHDRYANIEVGYLLQRMEAYRGLAILTTNRKESLDAAFLRRIRFVAEFPFPEAAQRAEIWRRVFPQATPTEGLRIDRLARLSAAGGNIYNIAMGAAFLAADAGEPVRMAHLLSAARSEFTKIERPLTEAETAGWV